MFNCFRAIAAQCPEDGTDTPMNHFSLRSEVAQFARESTCPKIVELRENYDEVIESASGTEIMKGGGDPIKYPHHAPIILFVKEKHGLSTGM